MNNVWAEITKLSHGHGGPGWELGTCLWSPAKSKNNADRYALMRQVAAGDRVYHLVGGVPGKPPGDRFFWGASVVASPAEVVRNAPPQPGDWAGRPAYYRVDLRNFTAMRSPLPLHQLQEEIRELLLDEVRRDRAAHYPFATYGEGFRTAQGMYLTKPSPRLERILAEKLVADAA